MGFIETMGHLIILSILWIVCSLPIITIGSATTALYYSTVKAVRRNVGYPYAEFLKSFKKNLLKGSILTIGIILVVAIALLGREYISGNAGAVKATVSFTDYLIPANSGEGILLYIAYDGLILVTAMITMYIFPVLSRFEMRIFDLIKLAFVMAIRFIHITAVLLICFMLMALMLYRILPIWVLIILPGGYAYGMSFLIEKAMKKYIKVTEDNKDEWYIF